MSLIKRTAKNDNDEVSSCAETGGQFRPQIWPQNLASKSNLASSLDKSFFVSTFLKTEAVSVCGIIIAQMVNS